MPRACSRSWRHTTRTTPSQTWGVRILLYYSSNFSCLWMSLSLSLSLVSIYCCLLSFSDTTWHETNHHPPLNQSSIDATLTLLITTLQVPARTTSPGRVTPEHWRQVRTSTTNILSFSVDACLFLALSESVCAALASVLWPSPLFLTVHFLSSPPPHITDYITQSPHNR